MKREETIIQERIIKYINLFVTPKYPDRLIIVDGLKDAINGKDASFLMKQAQNKGFEKGQPDLMIVQKVEEYSGFALEIKTDYSEVFTKNGELRIKKVTKKDRKGNIVSQYDHNQMQFQYLERLGRQGWYAVYGFGYEDCIRKINDYFKITNKW